MIALLVLWRLPREAIGGIARYFLSHTSQIYNRVIVERFRIKDTTVGLLLRLMVVKECFVGVVDEDNVIAPSELHNVIEKVCSGRNRIDSGVRLW